ncbi:Uncharacterised protein [Mycobacterium tuberculosis]|nr:Uncharacterised protein [Mycobacterium tuberculosis]
MKDIDYDPKVADPETVRSQVETHLTAIKKIADLPKGEGLSPAALINLDVRGIERGYAMNGSFSIWGLSNKAIGDGYARVRAALPAAGWRISKEGRDPMWKQDPELWAERGDDHSKLSLEWIQPTRSKGPILLVTIDSRIYVAPPGVDLNTKI